MAAWIGADNGAHYINLDLAEMFYASDAGDGTWTVNAVYSDFSAKLDTGTVYDDKASALAAVAAHLGANLLNAF